jgi:hypothetical protein
VSIPDRASEIPPVAIAGALLAVRNQALQRGLVMSSVDQIVSAMGASRSRAYEIKDTVVAFLPTLVRPPGRPRIEPAPAPPGPHAALMSEALCFLMRHPGCLQVGEERARYSDHYRRFVIELRERYAEVVASEFAEAIQLPLGTLQDWMRNTPPDDHACDDTADPHEQAGHGATDSLEAHAGPEIADPRPTAEPDARRAQIETVLAAWRVWHGDFGAFCAHVRRDHRLELGNTLIASILFAHGARTPARRAGRSRDEEALRGSFETFFPGAQWVGDGKQLKVVLDGKTFCMNLELIIDAASDAAVGISIRDEEDSAAVIEAFEHGKQTTGDPPLAQLLDNRPSNHTPEVDAALDATMRIRATPARPQNKAHVEGAFGLFAQKVPALELDTRNPHTLAKTIARLVATTFFRALNRAPRRDRDGKTRVDLYAQDVTPEQREAARAALRERMRKQELARQTRAARLDPVIRALLDDGFARLGLLDPERHFRDAIACYPRDAIVDAMAIFAGKRTAGTLPEGVDARYLLGIVKNVHHLHEAEPITEALIRERLAARDRFLAPLVRERAAILAAGGSDVSATLIALVDRLVRAEHAIDRHVWLDAAADLVAPLGHDERIALAQCAARRIHTAFKTSSHDRDRLERSLLRRLWPLE